MTSSPRVSTNRNYQNGGLTLENRPVENRIRDNFWTGGDGDAVETATLTFLTTSDSEMALMTWPDIGRHPKFKIAATETGSVNNFWTEIDFDAVPAAAPTLSSMSDSDLTLPTYPDIGRHREQKMSVTKTSSFRSTVIFTSGFRGRHVWFSMSIGRCRAVSGVSYLSRAWSKMWE